jgi:hypothetical protein
VSSIFEAFVVEAVDNSIRTVQRFRLEYPFDARSSYFRVKDSEFSLLGYHDIKVAYQVMPRRDAVRRKHAEAKPAITEVQAPSSHSPHLGLSIQTTPLSVASPSAIATIPSPSPSSPFTPVLAPPAVAVSRLVNPSLPPVPVTNGLIPQTIEQCQRAMAVSKQRLDSVLENANQLLQSAPKMIRKDHMSLVGLALEAMMTELQQSDLRFEQNNGFESQFLATMLDDIARNISDGLVDGIKDGILNELDPQLRNAVSDQLKKVHRDVFKQRVDAAIKNIGTEFISELEKRQKEYERHLENYGKDIRKCAERAVLKLKQHIVSLEAQLNSIVQSGVLEEVKRLREEVQKLRKASEPTVLSPETIIAQAKSMIEAGQVKTGFEYIVKLRQPQMTIALLGELIEDIENLITHKDLTVPLLLDIVKDATCATDSKQLAISALWVEGLLLWKSRDVVDAETERAIIGFASLWKKHDLNDAGLKKKIQIIEAILRK